jgi:glycerophosphoryl diester phosphodiesterase
VATSASRDEALCWRASAAIGKAVERPAYRALQLPVSYAGVPLLTHKSIARAHAAGVKVHAWTIDRPADMRDLLELGVDGIMTDRPDILLRVLGSHKRGA